VTEVKEERPNGILLDLRMIFGCCENEKEIGESVETVTAVGIGAGVMKMKKVKQGIRRLE
jgi:hypothetical protein